MSARPLPTDNQCARASLPIPCTAELVRHGQLPLHVQGRLGQRRDLVHEAQQEAIAPIVDVFPCKPLACATR